MLPGYTVWSIFLKMLVWIEGGDIENKWIGKMRELTSDDIQGMRVIVCV